MILSSFLYLLLEEVLVFRRGWGVFFAKGIVMILLAAICIFPVYVCIRYIPPLRHHPVWFQGEYSEDGVHAWDPIDSPKYISLQSAFHMVLERVGIHLSDGEIVLPEDVKHEEILVGDKGEELLVSSVVFDFGVEEPVVSDVLDGDYVISYGDGVEVGSDPDHPAFVHPDYAGMLLGRQYVYRYFLRNLNLFGHRPLYANVWVTGGFEALHAHNSFLQIAYHFGIIPGFLFLLIPLLAMIWVPGRAFRGRRVGSGQVFSLVVLAGYMAASMLECITFPGEIQWILYFLVLLPLIRGWEEKV